MANIANTKIMKNYFYRRCLPVVVACLALCFSLNLLAGTPAPGDLLRQAYGTLEQADHDYKGHRLAAMKQIEAAAALLNVNLKGDGKGHEKQVVSDEQLRSAQGLLQQAAGGLTGQAQKHVHNAIHQISLALEVK